MFRFEMSLATNRTYVYSIIKSLTFVIEWMQDLKMHVVRIFERGFCIFGTETILLTEREKYQAVQTLEELIKGFSGSSGFSAQN